MDGVATISEDMKRNALGSFVRLYKTSLVRLLLIALALSPIVVIISIYERVSPNELDIRSACLVIAAWLSIVSVALVATARLTFSLLVADTVISGLTGLSIEKYKYLNTIIHSYDLVHYSRDFAAGGFFIHAYPGLVIGIAACLAAVLAVLVCAFLLDRLRVERKLSFGMLIVSLLLYDAAFHSYGNPRTVYRDAYHASSFFASMRETVDALRRGNLLMASAKGTPETAAERSHVSIPAATNPPGVRPTIVVILHESTFPLELFPIVTSGTSPTDLFRSDDGKLRRLQVETWGGGTWTSEYGFLNGISTYYFGNLRNFLSQFMTGKIKTGLAYELKADGYKTIVIYPFSGDFMSTRQYDQSIGIDEFLDINDLKMPSQRERDNYYYSKVLEQISEADRNGSTQPLFIFVDTMASHSPYDYRLYPEVEGFDSVTAKDAIWTEYVRRLSMDDADLSDFLKRLKIETRRPMMVVGFGDHQPAIAGEFADPTKEHHTAFTTFYRVNTLNFDADFSKLPESLDVPFLGTALLEASGLPMSESFKRRAELLRICDGQYADCADQQQVLRFHRWLIQQGLVLQ